ncbi:MAG TPA: hypothetical protein VGD94_15845 [Vicinamibacterales bacterium]
MRIESRIVVPAAGKIKGVATQHRYNSCLASAGLLSGTFDTPRRQDVSFTHRPTMGE